MNLLIFSLYKPSDMVAIVLYEVLRQQDYKGLLRDEPHKSSTFIEDFNED